MGTYVTLANPGSVTFSIQASGAAGTGATPRMNLVIDDSKTGWDVGAAPNTYTQTLNLPAGTHFVRTEFNNFLPSTGQSLTIQNLQVSGATLANTNVATTALAAADTYIANYRRGAANVALRGPANIPLLPGTQVNVDLRRHAFNFGTAVPGNSASNVSSYLGSSATAQQTNYQSRLLANFNAVVPENAGKWSNNESWTNNNFAQDNVFMSNVDQILSFAASHNLRARMHNVIWGSQQPTPVGTYLTNGSAGSLSALRGEITERNDYYFKGYVNGTVAPDNQRADKISEVDIYNESFHTGSAGGTSTYWNRYGVNGIADIYREARDNIAAAGSSAAVFVNDYNIYADGTDKFANWFRQHTETLRNAGVTAGYGQVVGGIGTQYYVNNAIDNLDPNRGGADNGAHNPARIMQTIQNLSTMGVPIALTEFGVKAGATQTTAAQMLSDSMRITFGNAAATGFFMWGFHAENGGGNLFAPAAALFNVNTTNWSAWTITEAGKAWQDLLGIQDWDGDPNDAWDTNLNATVNADGSIDFTGFFGDYAIGGQNFALNLVKGTTSYQVNLAAPPDWHFWNASNSGSFSAAGNWTNGVPGGVGQTAHFGPTSAPRDVTIDSPVTLGQINIDSNTSYSISGAAITLEGFAGVAAIYVTSGTHSIDAPIQLNDNLTLSVATSASLNITGDVSATGRVISKVGGGAAQLNNVRSAGLNIAQGRVKISAKPLNNDPAGTSVIGALSIADGATLDLSNNSAVIDDGSLSAITALVASGYNGGDWNGDGITANAAPPSFLVSVGVARSTDLFASFPATFAGQQVDDSAILLMYTTAGDANFDARTDIGDFSRLAASFNLPGRWTSGDFNFDGSVSIADFAILAGNFNQSLAATAPRGAVPEPTTLSAFSIALLARWRSTVRGDAHE